MERRIAFIAISRAQTGRLIRSLEALGARSVDMLVFMSADHQNRAVGSNLKRKGTPTVVPPPKHPVRGNFEALEALGTFPTADNHGVLVLGGGGPHQTSDFEIANCPSVCEILTRNGLEKAHAIGYEKVLQGNLLVLVKLPRAINLSLVLNTLKKLSALDIIVTKPSIHSGCGEFLSEERWG